MKSQLLEDKFGDDESSTNDQMTEAISDALSRNDKVIEIRPAKRSKGMGLKSLLLAGVGAIGLAYWVRNSQKPDEILGSVKEEAANRTQQAAETIEEGSETASERMEVGSEKAGETVQEAGQAVQEVGEKAAERTEEAGEKASDETESAANDSSGM